MASIDISFLADVDVPETARPRIIELFTQFRAVTDGLDSNHELYRIRERWLMLQVGYEMGARSMMEITDKYMTKTPSIAERLQNE